MSTKNKKRTAPVKTSKPAKKPAAHRDMSTVNIVLAIATILADLGMVYTMMNTTRFASLSKSTFILVNILVLILLAALNVVVMLAIRNRKRPMYVLGTALMAVFLLIGTYGAIAVSRVNTNIEKITGTETTESVSTSLVVYNDGESAEITDVAMLDGKTVGYAAGTKPAELGKAQIDAQKVNVSYQEYQDYSSEFIGLLSGEIQCAIFPSNYEAIFTQEASLRQYLENTKSIMDFTDTVKVASSASSGKDLTKEPFTVLLIGNADGLSDTMILCSVNPISMRVTMSSIARDSYVPITCYGGGYSKINAANAVSRECLMNTITSLVGVDIDYYVEVNFQGVVEIVDAIGGITVDSPLEFVGQTSSTVRGTKTVWVPAGKDVPLNGEQALAFARERYAFSTGDFARQEHQQQVIMAMVTKILRTRDINTFLKILDAAGNNIKTNITIDQMTGFMKYALQKSNRLYDKDHVEDVFDIITSRVTGYSSGLWDSGMQLILYIYRLYNGSLADTRAFITRNIDMNSAITHEPIVEWSVNWDVQSPVISALAYNEAIIPSDVPPEVLEQHSEEQGCAVNAVWNGNSCECEGGYTGDGYTKCEKVNAEPEETATPEPTEAPKCGENAHYDGNKGACVCDTGFTGTDPTVAGCKVDATPTPATPTPGTPEPHQHSYSLVGSTPASCTTEGSETYQCSCGESYTNAIPALGHDMQLSARVDPTCDTDGYETYTCSRCGATTTNPLPALGGCEPPPQPE